MDREVPGEIVIQPIMPRIAREVAEEYGVTVENLRGPVKTNMLVEARWEAFSRIRAVGRFSLPQIGAFFNRDHTTVLHGLRRHAERSNAVNSKPVNPGYGDCSTVGRPVEITEIGSARGGAPTPPLA